MPELVADCPRCGSRRMTFDVKDAQTIALRYDWQLVFEAFSICRHCNKSTTFVLDEKGIDEHRALQKAGFFKITDSLNNYVEVRDYVSLKDESAEAPPEHVPPDIEKAFREGATCLAVDCPNAAATMFRLCIDLTTRPMLPADGTDGLNKEIRRSLGNRLQWLFRTGRLPEALKELSTCIKEDGNDGAHAGTLTRADAEDVLDFTVALLERVFTEPKRLEVAKDRRAARRQAAKKQSP